MSDPEPEITSSLLAIAGEALSNVVRHSRAANARITADGPPSSPSLVLVVEDDGRGFDPAAVTRHGHQGLSNMRERAAAIGGTLSWEPAPGAGTRVVVRLPEFEGDGSPP